MVVVTHNTNCKKKKKNSLKGKNNWSVTSETDTHEGGRFVGIFTCVVWWVKKCNYRLDNNVKSGGLI